MVSGTNNYLGLGSLDIDHDLSVEVLVEEIGWSVAATP